MTKVDCFKAGTCTAKSMARLRSILNEEDVVRDYTNKKFARLEGQFNPDAMKSSDSDDSYSWEEPWMHPDATICEADSVIVNTGINPLMFEEWIDTEARTNVLYLRQQSRWFKDTPKVSKEEMDKRDEVEPEKPSNPHYRLMEVKHEKTWNIRRFYWNWTEGYETNDEDWDADNASEDQEEFKNKEKMEYKRKQKVVIQLLYKKLKESKAWMKLAATQKKRALYAEFKKEYEYCSNNLDKINEIDKKIKELPMKRRKDKLRTKLIKLNNLWSKVTVEKIKRMINEKSLAYAEKVVDNELANYKRS